MIRLWSGCGPAVKLKDGFVVYLWFKRRFCGLRDGFVVFFGGGQGAREAQPGILPFVVRLWSGCGPETVFVVLRDGFVV